MCAERGWPVGQWRELLVGHPLAGRLVTRLVWEIVLDGDAGAPVVFRPTEEGELLGADDAPVELAGDAVVRLAHGTRLTEPQIAAWREHFDDYEVTPLFDQLSAVLPSFEEGATVLNDLQGHITNTSSVRAAATKHGYTFGGEVSRSVLEYVRTFSSLALTAVLNFASVRLPGQNPPSTVIGLAFRRGRREVPLTVVPPVLLAECYADYAALAALGAYDPDWKSKMPF